MLEDVQLTADCVQGLTSGDRAKLSHGEDTLMVASHIEINGVRRSLARHMGNILRGRATTNQG